MFRNGAHSRFGHPSRSLVFCLYFLAVTAALSPSVTGAETKPLVFLGDKDYPPLAYLDNQKPTGMAVDVVKALAGPMKRPIRIELMDWSVAQQKVLNGEADAVLEMSSTPERQKLFDFASSTFTHEFGFVVRSGSISIRSGDDLKRKIIGVTSGGFPRNFLQTRTDFKLVIIENYRQGFDRVAAGSLDAVAVDLWVAA
jgi:glutamine transport system permease protein